MTTPMVTRQLRVKLKHDHGDASTERTGMIVAYGEIFFLVCDSPNATEYPVDVDSPTRRRPTREGE